MDLRPSPRQQDLMDLAYKLAVERFAPRAADLDRDASFPVEDYRDLQSSGLLALCVPEEYGGHGAGFETYCLVAEQLAQGNAATALTFNMHCLVMLMMGPFMEGLELPPDVQARHQFLSAKRYREVVEQGVFYGQPHSEPIESGDQDQLTVGGRRFGGTWEERRLYLSIPRDAPGLEFTGDWDPVGMRSTVSRDMSLNNVRATEDAEVLPPGVFGQLYQRQPHILSHFPPHFSG